MLYDFTKHTAPKMPPLGKGLECIKLLASQVSPDMRESVVPMLFSSLGAHVSGAEFQYPSLVWMEPTGQIAHLVGPSGIGKGQLTRCTEAIMRRFREHDKAKLQEIVEWSKTTQSKGANKDKPARPDAALWFPPANTTSAAFLQNAMALELEGNHAQFFEMPEVEMAERMCGGHKWMSVTIRNIFDCARDGALRATANGVTGNPILRANMEVMSTPVSARNFYRNEVMNGTLGRVRMSYKPRQARSGKIPRQGTFDATFLSKLDLYLDRLEACKGRFIIPKLNKIADQLAAEMANMGDLTDNDPLWEMGKRAIIGAWKCGCIMWILNGQQWTRSIGEMVVFLAGHDMWSKMQVFGDMFLDGDAGISSSAKSGPKNMLDSLPDSFSEVQLENIRTTLGKSQDAKNQLKQWLHRKFITYSAQTGLYTKTEEYLRKHPQPQN